MVRVRSFLAVAGCTVATLSLALLTNCGGSTTTGSTSTTSTSSGGGGSAASLSHPPAAGAMKPGDGATAVTFAISQLFLGDTDPCKPAAGSTSCTGTPDKVNGWKSIGYDLDGQNDTATGPTTHCKPVAGANRAKLANGNNGIDNSFGENILPVILGLSSTASAKINQDITAGKFTVMFDIAKLGTGNEYNPLTTNLFAGGDLGSAPKFDGTDNWPVLPSLLNDGMTIAGGSKVNFATSYVTNNTWVSGSPGTVTLSLSISSVSLSLVISNALISFDMDSTHHHVTNGIIAGVLNTEALTSQIQQVAGTIDPSLCSGQTITSILQQIAEASDIGSDGKQTEGTTCDGISIGLGFNGELVQNPTVVSPASTLPSNPCATGGSSASSSTAGSTSGSSGSGSGAGGGDAG